MGHVTLFHGPTSANFLSRCEAKETEVERATGCQSTTTRKEGCHLTCSVVLQGNREEGSQARIPTCQRLTIGFVVFLRPETQTEITQLQEGRSECQEGGYECRTTVVDRSVSGSAQVHG